MPLSISSGSSNQIAGFISHAHELSPGPESKIFAIPLLTPFKLLWGHPVIFFIELLLIRYVLAFAEKLAYFVKARTSLR
jgi:hypothetical protein